MIRNFKILGVAVVAALAMTALLASAAQAEQFTPEKDSGTIFATQTTEQLFTTTAGTVKCSFATQEGQFSINEGLPTEFATLEVTATYAGCKAFGFLSASVKMGNCKYRFTGEGQATFTALVDIVCTSGEITVSTLSCVVHVPAQNGLAHIVFANNASTGAGKHDVDATVTIEKIKYTETSGCPNVPETKTTENGTLTGGATIIAKDTSGNILGLTVD